MGLRVWVWGLPLGFLVFRVWGLRFRVWSLGFGVLELGVGSLGLDLIRVWGFIWFRLTLGRTAEIMHEGSELNICQLLATFELWSKLLKRGYIWDYIWEFYRGYWGGILGVYTTAHVGFWGLGSERHGGGAACKLYQWPLYHT